MAQIKASTAIYRYLHNFQTHVLIIFSVIRICKALLRTKLIHSAARQNDSVVLEGTCMAGHVSKNID